MTVATVRSPAEYEERGRQARQWVEGHSFADELDTFEARIIDLVVARRHH